jgi:hypothetical protein
VQKGDYKGWKWDASLKLGVRQPATVDTDTKAFD